MLKTYGQLSKETSPPPATFDGQFADVRRFDHHWSGQDYHRSIRLSFVDIRPETESKTRPLLVVPGFSVGLEAQRDLARSLYDSGQRSLVVEFTDVGQTSKWDRKRWNLEQGAKGGALTLLLGSLNPGPVDALAHSEGALGLALAATSQPGKFGNLVLFAPAGMIGRDWLPSLGGRFLAKAGRGQTRDRRTNPAVAQALTRGAVAHAKNNSAHTRREVRALAAERIDKTLAQVRLGGPRIGLIQAPADRLFNPSRIAEQVRLEPGENQNDWASLQNVDIYASLADRASGHDAILIEPKPTVKTALELLEALDRLPRPRPKFDAAGRIDLRQSNDYLDPANWY